MFAFCANAAMVASCRQTRVGWALPSNFNMLYRVSFARHNLWVSRQRPKWPRRPEVTALRTAATRPTSAPEPDRERHQRSPSGEAVPRPLRASSVESPQATRLARQGDVRRVLGCHISARCGDASLGRQVRCRTLSSVTADGRVGLSQLLHRRTSFQWGKSLLKAEARPVTAP